MDGVSLVDVLVPTHQLRAVLEAMRQRGQTQITFEGLRYSCRLALETGGATGAIATAQRTVPELSSAATAVAAARIVYHYVKRKHLWSVTADRRERHYYVSSMLETLDWMQSQVMLAENEGEAV